MAKQVDLETLIAQAKVKSPQGELTDAFTGEVFNPRSRNHYEVNDGVPFAPPLDLKRPTIRQRIENLINRDPGLLQRYIDENDDGSVDMEIPDDPDAPLTGAEAVYLDMVAAQVAEAAPLPDDGMPRPDSAYPSSAAPSPEAASAPGGGQPAATPQNAPAASAVAPTAAPAAPATPPVPTR